MSCFDNIVDTILRVNTFFTLLTFIGFNNIGQNNISLVNLYVFALSSYILSTSFAFAIKHYALAGGTNTIPKLKGCMLVSICISVFGTIFFMLAMRNLGLIEHATGFGSFMLLPSLPLLLLYLFMLLFTCASPN